MRKNLRRPVISIECKDNHKFSDKKRLISWGKKHIHGEDGGYMIQRGNKDSYLADPDSQQQSPGGLTVSLPMTKDLRKRDPKDRGLM